MTHSASIIRLDQGLKKTSLGEIPVDWEVTSFGEAFDFLRTANNSRADLNSTGEVRYIRCGDIHAKCRPALQCELVEFPRIDSEKVQGIPHLKGGDLVMADSCEDLGGVGASIEVTNVDEHQIVAGLHTFLLRDKGGVFADGFRGYIERIPGVRQWIEKSTAGTSVYRISKESLSRVPIPRPPLHEQSKIAAVLSSVDSAIDQAQSTLNRYGLLKIGLLPVLLSGKVRVE
ncbi:MAG: hypothetical protein COV48_11110 [Elusimicrobia bacterium CG11_big_fil_rev_8_21_14_0_20_64_6]|nr:MAG: hypothetical protein COV48_11110 [Elusimicrobia bacterium CG11_big_fil_rev_8_21_14_0_20_64_6]